MPPLPPGALSLVGLFLAVGLITAAVWILTSLGWALLAGGILGGLALVMADGMRDTPKGGGRG